MMKPFSAWLAMNLKDRPLYCSLDTEGGNLFAFALFTNARAAKRATDVQSQRVLIVPDTEENRRKLGMEE